MGYLAGDWVSANVLFGAVFLVAGVGIVGLAWWVLRGDRLNRELNPDEPVDAAFEPVPGAAHDSGTDR